MESYKINDIKLDCLGLGKNTIYSYNKICSKLMQITDEIKLSKIDVLIDRKSDLIRIKLEDKNKEMASIAVDIFGVYLDVFILGEEYFIQLDINEDKEVFDDLEKILRSSIKEKLTVNIKSGEKRGNIFILSNDLEYTNFGSFSFNFPWRSYEKHIRTYEPWIT